MRPKKTTKKTESDIRCFERHLICSELKLEDIECDTFDAFYNLEKRHQSKVLTHMIPEFRKIGGMSQKPKKKFLIFFLEIYQH